MRIIQFELNHRAHIGLLNGDGVVDITAAEPTLPASLDALVQAGNLDALRKYGERQPDYALNDVTLLPPLTHPGKIICLGLNYVDHAAEGGHARPEYPSFFLRTPESLIAHRAPIVRPRVSETLDYEAELAAVVGSVVPRHTAIEDALTHIVGYCCFNDASVRQYQRLTSQWTIGKNFDATGPFGPALVTADELPEGARGLRICSRLNGEIMQDANTDDMLFPVAETVALLSQCLTLRPGDLLVMGTPAGVGHARNPQVWMKPGDTCDIEIEGVGLLSNPIIAEA